MLPRVLTKKTLKHFSQAASGKGVRSELRLPAAWKQAEVVAGGRAKLSSVVPQCLSNTFVTNFLRYTLYPGHITVCSYYVYLFIISSPQQIVICTRAGTLNTLFILSSPYSTKPDIYQQPNKYLLNEGVKRTGGKVYPKVTELVSLLKGIFKKYII